MVDLTDREERLEALHHLLNRLPALNYAVFERLIFHLARSDFTTVAMNIIVWFFLQLTLMSTLHAKPVAGLGGSGGLSTPFALVGVYREWQGQQAATA